MAVCWLIVEPPFTRPPRWLFFQAFSMASKSKPLCSQKRASSAAMAAWTRAGDMRSSERQR